MIPVEPQLPPVTNPNWPQELTFALKKILREMAIGINKASGSTWDGPHPVLGTTHIWVDATGDLRIKASAPTSDTDGTVVGTQT